MTTMFDAAAMRKRYRDLHHAMTQRAKPKKWKSGKRQGMVKKQGISELPFLAMDLYEYAELLIGKSVIQCPYCVAIGRPANLIDLTNCVFDHHVPLQRGGTWELSNLWPCCKDCNALKGSMQYDVFIAVVRAIYQLAVDDPACIPDRDYLLKCLRSHGVIHQFNTYKRKEATAASSLPTPPRLPRQRTLDDDF